MAEKREMHKALVAELAKWPVSARFVMRGKHPSVVVSAEGRERFFIYSGSRAERRAIRNAVRDLRQVCAQVVGKGLGYDVR